MLDCYLSNRVEDLYKRFKENFRKQREPFLRRCVLVPSPPMKSWLMLQMARDPELGVAAGIEIGYVETTLRKFLKTDAPLPSRLEYQLAIEAEIRILWQEDATLQKYIGDICSPQGCKRISALAFELVILFEKYHLHGKEMLLEWERKPSFNWQQTIWKRVYGSKRLYDYYQHLEILPNTHLDLFGISFLPKVQLDMLQRLATHLPVRYYLLSPCEVFWSDLLTPRESQRLKKQWKRQGLTEQQEQEVESYLDPGHPLLASLGRLGRKMAAQIEDVHALLHEEYHPSLEKTVLGQLQNDMLTLTPPTPGAYVKDRSIQVHAAPSRLREIEILHDTLIDLLYKDKTLTPADILVMAPDIMDYAPLIKMVFAAEDKLAMQFMDLRLASEQPLLTGFKMLLTLAHNRWESASILELFALPAFQRKWQVDGEDLPLLRKWIEETGIRWGEDAAHKKAIFKREHLLLETPAELYPGTWQFGIERLLAGLVLRNHARVTPYDAIEATQGELLGKVILFLSTLNQDLLRCNEQLSLDQWVLHFKDMFARYFTPWGDEDEKATEHLQKSFTQLVRASKNSPEALFPFYTVHKHLQTLLNEAQSTYREGQLDAVRFSSLVPMRTVPVKTLVILGMHDEAFPRSETPSSLDQLRHYSHSSYAPTRTDYDRSLFLEALLSARHHFIVSYLNREDSENRPLAPSLLITELLHVIEQMGYPAQQCHYEHPLHGFDKNYFLKESSIRSYSQRNFKAAQQLFNPQRNPKHRFVASFPLPNHSTLPLVSSVDLKELKAFLKDPFKAYFSQQLGMYVTQQKEDRGELLLPSQLQLYQLRRLSHEDAAKSGLLPIGPFNAILQKRLDEERLDEANYLKNWGVESTEIEERIFELTLHCEGQPCLLKGKLQGVTSKGLIIPAKKTQYKLIEYLPEYLVFQCLAETHTVPHLLCLKDGKQLTPFTEEPKKALEELLVYYLRSRTTGSPLLPQWVEAFHNGKEIDSFYSDYANWHQKGMDLPDWTHWQKQSQELFGAMQAHWFPKKKAVDV